MLVTPQFLFRIEHDPKPTDAQDVHRISDVELASRLSYFLWSSMPDDELLSLAEAGKLHDPAVLDAQVKRMMADRRSTAFAANFAGQWLEIRNLDVVKPDPDKFPEWGPELRDAMKTETRMFFEYVLRENRPLSDFIDAKYTFLNARLAKFYGISGCHGSGFPARGVDRRRARRAVEPGERADGFELSDAHLRGAAREVCAEQYSGLGDSASAAGCAGARRKRGGNADVAAAADGEASRGSDVLDLP